MLHYILKRTFNRSYKRDMNVSSIWPLFYWVPVNVIRHRYLAFVISMETLNSAYRSTHFEVQAAHFCRSLPRATAVLRGSSVVQHEGPDQRNDVSHLSVDTKLRQSWKSHLVLVSRRYWTHDELSFPSRKASNSTFVTNSDVSSTLSVTGGRPGTVWSVSVCHFALAKV